MVAFDFDARLRRGQDVGLPQGLLESFLGRGGILFVAYLRGQAVAAVVLDHVGWAVHSLVAQAVLTPVGEVEDRLLSYTPTKPAIEGHGIGGEATNTAKHRGGELV